MPSLIQAVLKDEPNLVSQLKNNDSFT